MLLAKGNALENIYEKGREINEDAKKVLPFAL
jgi:hypothetical protein